MEIPDGPPEDPEEWSDEQWIAWLEATDPESAGSPEEAQGPVVRGSKVIRSSGGVVLGAAMSGLAEILQGQNEPEVVVVAEGPEGTEDRDFTVTLGPDGSGRSVVRVRRPAPKSDPPSGAPGHETARGDGP